MPPIATDEKGTATGCDYLPQSIPLIPVPTSLPFVSRIESNQGAGVEQPLRMQEPSRTLKLIVLKRVQHNTSKWGQMNYELKFWESLVSQRRRMQEVFSSTILLKYSVRETERGLCCQVPSQRERERERDCDYVTGSQTVQSCDLRAGATARIFTMLHCLPESPQPRVNRHLIIGTTSAVLLGLVRNPCNHYLLPPLKAEPLGTTL